MSGADELTNGHGKDIIERSFAPLLDNKAYLGINSGREAVEGVDRVQPARERRHRHAADTDKSYGTVRSRKSCSSASYGC